MINLTNAIKVAVSWYAAEYIKDYREVSARIYELTVKTNTQINQIILTVSVASLAAIAALNKAVFEPYGILAFAAILMFVAVILISVVNLYLSTMVLTDIRQKLTQNLTSFTRLNKNTETYRFKNTQRILNIVIMISFCVGLVLLLALLGFYIMGPEL